MRLIVVAALMLAGCGGGDSPAPKATPTAQPLSDVQQQIAVLDDKQRNAVFIRAIRDAGRDCQGVTGSERRDDVSANGTPTWVATCQGGAVWIVSIARDGTAQVAGARGQ
ncbi:hypothetical protein SAMN06297144_0024 [Sphingomonas guangdongensis]|uniref:Uncharacterized protein n=1 Tax=Sphingomonas guangdongensis TaxID=1141890 RepID=A0A285QAP5_9SPHN|nr:hypothetical protein [Sphingomonas guangdongensis]SOB78519.1 hypothetical protein SAMN06297144_0024 [Sphingomonas guangdongensis]